MNHFLLPIVLLAATIALVACGPDKKAVAKAPATEASADDDNANLLAPDPTSGFADFKAVGTDGVSTPDCCKLPLANTKATDKTKI